MYRLVENEAFDLADGVISMYSQFLAYYPFRFTFVRDILAYFYGHLPGKLIVRILNVLDIGKVLRVICLLLIPVLFLFLFLIFALLL